MISHSVIAAYGTMYLKACDSIYWAINLYDTCFKSSYVF